MDDRLVEIEPGCWTKLRCLYDSKNYLTLSTLDNYIRWNQNELAIEDVKIYSLNGDWSDGTFVIVHQQQIFVSSLDVPNRRLEKLLDLLDYSESVRFMPIPSEYYSTVCDVLKRKELNVDQFDMLLYHLPKENALQLEVEVLEEEFCLRPLTAPDVIVAYEDRRLRQSRSLDYFQKLAELNPNCGVFTNAGELISSAFQTPTGSLCSLHTRETYQGRGIAKAVVKNIFKQTAELGQDSFAGVLPTNVVSRALFENIGCEVVDTVYQINASCDCDDGCSCVDAIVIETDEFII